MSGLPMDALFEALANGLWRGCVLAFAAALILRLFKRTTAGERYAVWLAVLTVIALAPPVEALLSYARLAAPPPVETTAVDALSIEKTALLAAAEARRQWEPLTVSPRPILWLWSVVGLALIVRLGRRCSLAAKLKRNSSQPDRELRAALAQWESRLASSRVGATRVTNGLRSPAAVGWIEPAVLLPEDSRAALDSKDLEMLWRHEQAHVGRRDDWTQLLSECLFALAWFHPAAHWVRRQVEKERELACDETVVNGGVEAGLYAGALGRWAERSAAMELPVGMMGLGSRALIIRRIEMLLSPSRILRRDGGRWAYSGSLAVALGASAVLVASGPVVIRAQTAAEPAAADVAVDVRPVVEIAVPVAPVVADVRVEPVLVSQVAPPAPPAPPAPVHPGPPVPPASAVGHEDWARAMAERAQRWREEMQPQLEAIQREAARIQEAVRAQLGPQQEKLREAARAMAEEHAKSIQPLAKQMAELGVQMAEASEARREELAAQMEALSEQMKEKEPELRRLQEEISKIEIDMRPFEEEMRELEEGLREKQKAFQEAERKFRESAAQPGPPER